MKETQLVRPMKGNDPEISVSRKYGVFTISVMTRATSFHVTLSEMDTAKLGKLLAGWAIEPEEETS